MNTSVEIRIATEEDLHHCPVISEWYVLSSKERGTGIASRTPEYLETKMRNRNSMIAFVEGELAGFCYIEVFSDDSYVSNSGLIVTNRFRGLGLAKEIKKKIFNYARDKYPNAKVFGITTSDIVMNINSDLGYRPVSFSQLTTDEEFWKGCSSCRNYDILLRNNKKMCLCTAMLAPSKNTSMKFSLEKQIIQENK